MSDLVNELFKHNTWANLKLLEFVRDLGEDHHAADSTVVGTRGPIIDTLTHIVIAQEAYCSMLGRGERPANADFPGWDVLLQRAKQSSETLAALAAETADGAMIPNMRFRGAAYEMRSVVPLIQTIEHARDHRSQIATQLTQLDIEPPVLDGWTYGETFGFSKRLETT